MTYWAIYRAVTAFSMGSARPGAPNCFVINSETGKRLTLSLLLYKHLTSGDQVTVWGWTLLSLIGVRPAFRHLCRKHACLFRRIKLTFIFRSRSADLLTQSTQIAFRPKPVRCANSAYRCNRETCRTVEEMPCPWASMYSFQPSASTPDVSMLTIPETAPP